MNTTKEKACISIYTTIEISSEIIYQPEITNQVRSFFLIFPCMPSVYSLIRFILLIIFISMEYMLSLLLLCFFLNASLL